MMGVKNKKGVTVVPRLMMFFVITYALYFNIFSIVPFFSTIMFPGSSLSGLTGAATLGNVIRFHSYPTAGYCHYDDLDGLGYPEVCQGSNGQFTDGCSGNYKTVYECGGSNNCISTDTSCLASEECYVQSNGMPNCRPIVLPPPTTTTTLSSCTPNNYCLSSVVPCTRQYVNSNCNLNNVADDSCGGCSSGYSCSSGSCVLSDTTGPTVSVSVLPSTITLGDSSTVSVTASDSSGVGNVYYALCTNADCTTYTFSTAQNCGGALSCTKSWTVTPTTIGSMVYWGYASDSFSNGGWSSGSVTLTVNSADSAPPTTIDNSDASWHTSDVVVTLACTDTGTGCANTYYCVDVSGPIDCTPFTSGNSVLITQTGWLRYYSVDNNGNTEGVKNSANLVKIDKADPTSSFSSAPADGSWVTGDFGITVNDADTGGSDLASCEYNVCDNLPSCAWTVLHEAMDGSCSGSSLTVTKMITVGSSGDCRTQGTNKCQVQAYAKDNAGRTTNPVAFRTYSVDHTAPASSVNALPGTSNAIFDVAWTVNDAMSGAKQVDIDVSVNSGAWSFWQSCQTVLPCWISGMLPYTGFAGNTYAFRSRAVDNAGNVENVHAIADTATAAVGSSSVSSPASGGNVITLTPTLDWTDATGANCYAVQIWDGAAKLIEDHPAVSIYSVPVGLLSYQKTYDWKVWTSADSCATYRSPVTATFNTKLPAPVINSPFDGGSTSITPALQWQRSGDANYYNVEFETPGQLKRTDYVSSISDPTNYAVSSALLQDKTYTWRVFPSNNGGSTYSPFASADRTFVTGGACAGISSPCEMTSLTNTGGGYLFNTVLPDSLVKIGSPGYWYVDLPAGTASYALVANTQVVSGTGTFNVRAGTTAGGSEVCADTAECSEGVLPGRYYITITASIGSAIVKPGGSALYTTCGTGTPIQDDITGTGICSITLTHLAKDVTDSSTGRYKSLGLSGTLTETTRTIEFDDTPSGGCDMDLQFANTWDNSAGSRRIRSELIDKDASHTLAYGYKLESTDCKITVASACAGLFPCPVPQSSADKKSVTVTSEDTWPLYTFDWDINECLPSENTDAAGYNAFCDSKTSGAAKYCDVNLKKCESCSVANNDPATSGNPNALDCPAGDTSKGFVDDLTDPYDQLVIGKCNLVSGGVKGGDCGYAPKCDLNTECSTACCSAVDPTAGPGIKTGSQGRICVTPLSSNNPINPYLCRNSV